MTRYRTNRIMRPGDADALVNLVLDLEAEGTVHEARRIAREASRCDPEFAPRLAVTRRALSDLVELPAAPDMTDSILDRVEAERPFLPMPARRRVSILRMAAAMGVLAAMTAYVLLERIAAQAPPAEPAGVGLGDASRADVTSTARRLAHTLGSVCEGGRTPQGPLTLGGTAAYEVGRPERISPCGGESRALVVIMPTPRGYAVVEYSPTMRGIRADEIRSPGELVADGEQRDMDAGDSSGDRSR
jgi:hypothetical protein